jgi:hypothetical protein
MSSLTKYSLVLYSLGFEHALLGCTSKNTVSHDIQKYYRFEAKDRDFL